MVSFAEARVDLGAISANIAALRERAGSVAVMGVVKADGYGHGMLPAAHAILRGGATWLGVALIEEALELRAGLSWQAAGTPIVAWIIPPGARLTAAIVADIDLGVSAPWLIEEIAAAAEEAGKPARIHLKADTGLNRGGVTSADWPDTVEAAARAQAGGRLRVTGVFSHFACADEPGHPSIGAQLAAFHEAVAIAEKAGLRPEVRHMANSAATLTLPEAHFDLVRPGIASYGLTPVPQVSGYGLRPAMTLAAEIGVVKRVPADSGVSYGHRYTTSSRTTLALVPVGYADGIPRAATNTAEVFVGGRRRRISGTVCMDQFMVDLGDLEAVGDLGGGGASGAEGAEGSAGTVRAGDEAVLFGPGDKGEPTAQDWADALGTISYEIVTRIGPRVPRVYMGG